MASEILYERPNLADTTHDGRELVSSKRLGFMLYIGLTVMLFAGLFGGYIILKGGNTVWPPAELPQMQFLVVLPHTMLLLAAVILMRTALAYSVKADFLRFRLFVGFAALVSIVFTIAFFLEWQRLIYGGLLFENVFGSIYFITTGVFIAHYIGGIIAQVRYLKRSTVVNLILGHNVGFNNAISWHYLMLFMWSIICFLIY
jgi:cytochrome c oxidase subunit III